jgi:hypothetical protein
MVSLLSPRRADPAISLEATVPKPGDRPAIEVEVDGPSIGWLPAAVAGAWLSSLAGWVLVAGLTVLGWLSAEPGTLAQALDVGTRLWLLANGVGVRLGPTSVTLVPWGVTLIVAFLVSRSAAFAARRIHPRSRSFGTGRSDERADARGTRRIRTSTVGPAMVGTVTTVSYQLPVVAVAALAGDPWAAPGRWLVVIAVIWLAAVLGAGRGLDEDLTGSWPRWARAVPRAVTGAQLVMLAAGAGLLATGLIVHLNRVVTLTHALQPGVAGGITLDVLQLAFAPNAIVWSGSYALGAGFAVGPGSAVAPAGTQLGILPGLPMLGALPATGAGRPEQLWWLAAGAFAGAVAAWIVVRRRPAVRFDEASLVGGLAGLLGGLVFTGLAWATGGDLGTLRLVGLGPRLLPLVIMAATTMGLSGMIVGLVLGILRMAIRRRTRAL